MTTSEIGELREGQKAIMRELVDFRSETRGELRDHETRIRANEKWKWSISGISGLIAAVFTTIFAGMFR